MAALCWTAVVLTVFLSAGGGRAAVDQKWLTGIVEGIKTEYALGGAFSLAVNVPRRQDVNTLHQVFQDDPADRVEEALSGGRVYRGTRVVVAAAAPDAVARVLRSARTLATGSRGDFLVVYSPESPCCPANSDDDAVDADAEIDDVARKWSGGYAFAFSKVADARGADASRLAESFKRLAVSRLGLGNIFRCYKPGGDPFRCTGCSSGGEVTPSCVANAEQGKVRRRRKAGECGRREKGSEVGTQSEPSGDGSREKGSMVRTQSEPSGDGSREKGSMVRTQSEPSGDGSREKGSMVRTQSEPSGDGSREKGIMVREQRKPSGKGSMGRKQSKPSGKGSMGRKQSKPSGKGSMGRKQSKPSGKGGMGRKQSKPRGGGSHGKGGKNVRKQKKRGRG